MKRIGFVGVGLRFGALSVALAASCSSPAKLGSEGTTCLLTTDCVAGLACVRGPAGSPNRCSKDFSNLVAMENPDAFPGELGGGSDAAAGAVPEADLGSVPEATPTYDAPGPAATDDAGAD